MWLLVRVQQVVWLPTGSQQNASIALIEAGGADNSPWIHIPVGYFRTMGNPKTTGVLKPRADPGLNGRTMDWPRGKVLGGAVQLMVCYTCVVNRRTLIIGASLVIQGGAGMTCCPTFGELKTGGAAAEERVLAAH